MSVPRSPSYDRHRSYNWDCEYAPPVDVFKINLSCSNLAMCDGQSCRQPEDAALVARTVRAAISLVSLLEE